MTCPQLFPATLVLAVVLLVGPAYAQMAAGPMTRIVRPNTPQNLRLVNAIDAANLGGVQDALASGANADAEASWEGPPGVQAGWRTAVVLSTQVPLVKPEKMLPIFRLLLRNLPQSEIADPKAFPSLLYEAVNQNDLASVQLLAARGAPMNPVHPGCDDILNDVLDEGDMRVKTLSPIFAFLLDHGAQVNVRNGEDMTPLMTAAHYGKLDVVRALLTHGADPALRDKRGLTALDWASRMGQDDVVTLLRDRSPMDIYEAAQFGDVPRLKAHLDAGENPNTFNASGMTPLMEAAQAGSLASARLLIERGAEVNQKLPDGKTALHLASLHGYAPLAALLLDHGTDVNATAGKPDRLVTPLTCAITQAQADVAALLLRRGADLSHGRGEAALDMALRQAGMAYRPNLRGRVENRRLSDDRVLDARGQIIDSLIGAGVDVRSKNCHALYLAANGGQAGIVEEFLDKGADVNGRGPLGPVDSQEDGETALMGAIEAWSNAYGEEAMLENGTESGADLKDIHQAEQYARQSVTLLLTHGADVNLPDAFGTTPLMLCVTAELPTLAKLLLAHGATVDAATPAGQTTLMLAAGEGNPRMATLLLTHHASVNRRDKLGRTSLMLAVDDGSNDERRLQFARNDEAFFGHPAHKPHPMPQKDLPNPDGHPDMVRLLLSHGAEVSAVAMSGATALSLARKEGFGPIVALLTQAGARR